MKNKDLKTVFWSTLKLSACTFGGGFVIIPLLRKRFVEELHWIDEQEMMDMTAIAQSSPGAIAVNASILVGWRVAGAAGALTAVAGTVLPPLVIISLVSVFYSWFRDNLFVSMAMAGMSAAVAAVILDVVFTMFRELIKTKRVLPLVILLAAFAAVRFWKINIVLIILACGLVGAVDSIIQMKKKKGENEQ